MSTMTHHARCGGTRYCEASPSRACTRCRLVLCDGKGSHWTGTQCLNGGAHKDASGKAAPVAKAPAFVPRPVAHVWGESGNARRGPKPNRILAPRNMAMRAEYEAGATLKDIAIKHGLHFTRVAHVLKSLGTAMRKQGPRPKADTLQAPLFADGSAA